MNGGLLYLDSSALVKFVLPEPETDALTETLSGWPERVSSALARAEVLRAVRRAEEREEVRRRAEEVVSRIGLIAVDGAVLSMAATLGPPELRTLDAIHLATALSVGEHFGAMVSYNARLLEAATGSGVTVLAPGREV